MRKTYTPPPEAVYRAGKRKANLTKAIQTLQLIMHEIVDQEDKNQVVDVILMLKRRREKLDEV